jgi:hypothetical protein
MIYELLFMLLILVGGCSLMHLTGLKGWPLPAVGFAAGIALQVIIGTIQAITCLPTSPVLTITFTFLIPVAGWIWFYIRGHDLYIKPLPALFAVLIFLLSALALRNIVSVTPDSFAYIVIGSLLESGNLSEASPLILLRRLIAVPLIHAPANLIGNFYLRSVTPLLALSTLICLAWLSYEGLRITVNDQRIIRLFSLLAVLLLVTNNRFVFNAFYINGHIMTALFLLLLVGSSWLMIRNAEVPMHSLVMLQILSIPVLTVVRPETSLLAGIALMPILISERIHWKKRAILLAVLGISVIAWQGFLWVKYSGSGESVPFSVMAMFGFGGIAILAIPALAWRRVEKLLGCSTGILEAGLWLAVVVMGYIYPGPLYRSIQATIENIFLDAGGWGISLVLLFAITTVILLITDLPDRLVLRFPLTTFIPFSFLLIYLREGVFRVGHGDSFNRMLLHILPLAVLLIILSISSGRRYLPEKLKRRWLFWKK